MTLRLAIVSTKGGVGKTTLTANLGALLADVGQRVLLVDADIQPTLSSYAGRGAAIEVARDRREVSCSQDAHLGDRHPDTPDRVDGAPKWAPCRFLGISRKMA